MIDIRNPLFIVTDYAFEYNECMNRMLAYRLQWYRRLMRAVLLRYKHVLILLIVVLFPTVTGLGYFLTRPIVSLIRTNHITGYWLVDLLILYFIYGLWIIMQKSAILSPHVNSYLQTFPIKKRRFLLIDFIMLLVANNILWIPIAWSFIVVFMRNSHLLVEISRLVLLVISIFIVQWFSLRIPLRFLTISNRPFYAIYFRENKLSIIFRVLLSMLAIIMTILIIVLGKQVGYLHLLSITTCAFVAFLVTGVANRISKQRAPYLSYLRSLPVSHYFWSYQDLQFLSVFIYSIIVFYFALLKINHFYHSGLFILILMLIFPLIIALYFIQKYWHFFGTLCAIMLTIAWSWLMISIG